MGKKQRKQIPSATKKADKTEKFIETIRNTYQYFSIRNFLQGRKFFWKTLPKGVAGI